MRHTAVVRLMVVEDDDGIAVPLVDGLRLAGFDVTRVATGRAALDEVLDPRGGPGEGDSRPAGGPPDMVLLDLGLPDIDGYEVCRRVRARSSIPILIITARGDEVDRVVGLELGADDYIVKPFGLRELIARIRAVSRRMTPADVEVEIEEGGTQRLGRLVVDRRARRVYVDGEEVVLSPKEFDLLSLLAEDPGAVLTRQRILEEVWDPHWYGPTKTLDVHVASLRRKLSHPEWIETVRGVGLRLGATR
jgi:two-component system, OmpR family, response regulator RegX3